VDLDMDMDSEDVDFGQEDMVSVDAEVMVSEDTVTDLEAVDMVLVAVDMVASWEVMDSEDVVTEVTVSEDVVTEVTVSEDAATEVTVSEDVDTELDMDILGDWDALPTFLLL